MILDHAAGVFVANALLAMAGAGMLLLLDAWRRLGRWTRPAVALLLGQASFVVVTPLLLYAGLSVSPVIVVPLLASLLGAGMVVHRRRNLPPNSRPGGGGLLASIVLAGPVLAVFSRALLHPLFQFDTMSNWVMKAAVIWGGDRLTGALDPRLFTRPDLHPQSHLEYPLGYNALLAWDFHWMGAYDIRVVHLQLALLLVAAAGTAWALLRPVVPALPLTAGLAGLVMMPGLVDRLLSAYADVPLALVWSAGALALIRWRVELERYLLGLATVFFAAALAMKQEGVVYDLAIYAAVAALLAARERRRLLELAASAGIVALTAVPWRLYVARHDLAGGDIRPGFERMQEQTANLRPTVDTLVEVLTRPATFVAVPVAVAFAIACLLRRRLQAEAGSLLLVTPIVLVLFVLVYWNAAVSLPIILLPALSRLVMGLVVLAWLLVPALVYSALAQREPPHG